MRCQYSRCEQVSSEKHKTVARAEVEEGADRGGVVTATVMGGYCVLPNRLIAITRRANSAKIWRSRTPARLYLCDPILERLAQDLEDMAAARRPCIQEEHAVVGPRHLARHRHVAPADPPHIGDGVMGGAKRPGRDQGRTFAREASDAMDARGLNGLSQGHGR
jgi:hypothetical protein